MSKNFGLNDVKEHVHNVLTTSFVKKTQPMSTLIVAPPERSKSNTVVKFHGKTVATINDSTSYGLTKKIEEHTKDGKCDFSHIVIPDLTRITARGRDVRKELVATLGILQAEGIQQIHTFNTNIDFKRPLQLGVITCITRLDLLDRRSIWNKIGFMSRFIPWSYNYDNKMKSEILDFIVKDVALEKDLVKVRKYRPQHVSIPDDIQRKLKTDAERIAAAVEDFCETPRADRTYGARALHQILSYTKSIALRDGLDEVNDSHYERFKHLSRHMNYDCLNISERTINGGKI